MAVFRVDWSTDVGLGHVQRCLALMDALAGHGFAGVFVARAGRGMAASVVESRGHAVLTIPANISGEPPTEHDDARQFLEALKGRPPQFVIVDHYDLGLAWETEVYEALSAPVVAVDGRADRTHASAVVVDPTFMTDSDRWRDLVAPGVHLLQGVQFTLVAPGFAEALRRRPRRDGTIDRILVSFGGSDVFDSTALAIEALMSPELDGLSVDVVIGATHPHPERIRSMCDASPSLRFHHATSRMVELSAEADLAIGAGGISVFERAFVGLPALVVIAAENQRGQVETVAATGAIENLGDASDLAAEILADRLARLRHDPEAVRSMSRAGRAMMRHALEPGSVLVAERIVSLFR